MTPLKPPRSVAEAVAGGAAGAGADAVAEVPIVSPSRVGAGPAGRRLLLRLGAPPALSGLVAAAGGAASGAGSGTGLPVEVGRRLRRLRRGAAVPVVAGAPAGAVDSWTRSRSRPARWRRTLAPTSPSAQSSPSAVSTSTRHTTIEFGAPPIGGRFWVSVQRAEIVAR